MGLFQKLLINLYGFLNRMGVLDNPVSKNIFEVLYSFYKRYYEDPYYFLSHKYPDLFRNGAIIDVGANIGYTAKVFCSINTKGPIFAIEPDQKNFEKLSKLQEQFPQLKCIQKAVGEKNGWVDFFINENHHADHRVVTQEYRNKVQAQASVKRIEVISVDNLVSSENLKNVQFIKIDVQGYELAVLEGMTQTVAQNPSLNISVEYCPEALIELGADIDKLIGLMKQFQRRAYTIHREGAQWKLSPLHSLDELKSFSGKYVEILLTNLNLS